MTLDFWLVARLAKDLALSLVGARIQNLSVSGSGIVFYCYRRGTRVALHISVDSNAPLAAAVSYSDTKENGTEGWAGGVAALLRGSIIDAVQAVPNDRVLYIDVSSRSSFGVPSRSRIVAELQPRKANALVLRPSDDETWTIVAAAKQFDGADDVRSVRTGSLYEPPPQRRQRLDRAQFILAVREAGTSDADRLARLLGEFDPECTPPLAREVVARVAASGATALTARALLDGWVTLRREVEDALDSNGEVFVTRPEAKPAVYHLVALRWPGGAQTSVPTVNELCVEALTRHPAPRGSIAPEVLRKKLTTMLDRCAREYGDLESARRRATEAEHLRAAGDAIYAHLTLIPAGAEHFDAPDGARIALDPLKTAKANAADYFRRYKKARSGLPSIESRLRVLRSNREYWEHLQWELARVAQLEAQEREPLLGEIADALGIKEQRKGARRSRSRELKVPLSEGAVALVGRSPKDNERLTFAVAGPNDYWFHARSIPGAHVIVKTDGATISAQQIEEAAAVAAGHSRASESASVEVDYTQRKHVRRRVAGRPGLVWYTDFKSVRVRPRQG